MTAIPSSVRIGRALRTFGGPGDPDELSRRSSPKPPELPQSGRGGLYGGVAAPLSVRVGRILRQDGGGLSDTDLDAAITGQAPQPAQTQPSGTSRASAPPSAQRGSNAYS